MALQPALFLVLLNGLRIRGHGVLGHSSSYVAAGVEDLVMALNPNPSTEFL